MKTLQVLAKVCIFYFVLLEVVSSEDNLIAARGNRLYIIDTEERYSWFEAFHKCKKNGKLAVIDSQAKNDALVELLKSREYNYNLWLGGHDNYHKIRGHVRPFFWSASGSKIEYSYWSNGNEPHCVHISKHSPDYRWNVADCLLQMGFVCELTNF